MLSGDASFTKLGFRGRRNGRRVWLRSGRVSTNASEQDTSDDDEPKDGYANVPLEDENRLAHYEAGRQKEQELDGIASVAISTGVEEEACSLLLLRYLTMLYHRFDSLALSDVYTNFQTFQSVLFPLGVNKSVENYSRGIHSQIQSKWEKHVPNNRANK